MTVEFTTPQRRALTLHRAETAGYYVTDEDIMFSTSLSNGAALVIYAGELRACLDFMGSEFAPVAIDPGKAGRTMFEIMRSGADAWIDPSPGCRMAEFRGGGNSGDKTVDLAPQPQRPR